MTDKRKEAHICGNAGEDSTLNYANGRNSFWPAGQKESEEEIIVCSL